MARLLDVPMHYRMPPAGLRPDLLERYPHGTTTLDLIRAGLRTSTTRRPFAQAGDVISFKGDASPFEVVQVVRPDLVTPAGRQSWEQAEGWNLGFIDADPRLRAQVYSPSAVQTIFRPYQSQQAAVPRIYAGIGSRSTPPEVLALMTPLAAAMQEQGWLLRSGGAAGADAAFEAGVSDPSRRAIYLPGRSFNGRLAGPGGYFDSTQLPGWQAALETVSRYHPAPDRLSPFARNLMARNAMQLLGPSLDRPADLVVAWTPGGQVTGGTGQALRMAADLGIEVRNLGRPEVLARARRFLGL